MIKTLAKPFEKPEELKFRAIAALAEKIGGNSLATPVPAAARQPRSKAEVRQ